MDNVRITEETIHRRTVEYPTSGGTVIDTNTLDAVLSENEIPKILSDETSNVEPFPTSSYVTSPENLDIKIESPRFNKEGAYQQNVGIGSVTGQSEIIISPYFNTLPEASSQRTTNDSRSDKGGNPPSRTDPMGSVNQSTIKRLQRLNNEYDEPFTTLSLLVGYNIDRNEDLELEITELSQTVAELEAPDTWRSNPQFPYEINQNQRTYSEENSITGGLGTVLQTITSDMGAQLGWFSDLSQSYILQDTSPQGQPDTLDAILLEPQVILDYRIAIPSFGEEPIVTDYLPTDSFDVTPSSKDDHPSTPSKKNETDNDPQDISEYTIVQTNSGNLNSDLFEAPIIITSKKPTHRLEETPLVTDYPTRSIDVNQSDNYYTTSNSPAEEPKDIEPKTSERKSLEKRVFQPTTSTLKKPKPETYDLIIEGIPDLFRKIPQKIRNFLTPALAAGVLFATSYLGARVLSSGPETEVQAGKIGNESYIAVGETQFKMDGREGTSLSELENEANADLKKSYENKRDQIKSEYDAMEQSAFGKAEKAWKTNK